MRSTNQARLTHIRTSQQTLAHFITIIYHLFLVLISLYVIKLLLKSFYKPTGSKWKGSKPKLREGSKHMKSRHSQLTGRGSHTRAPLKREEEARAKSTRRVRKTMSSKKESTTYSVARLSDQRDPHKILVKDLPHLKQPRDHALTFLKTFKYTKELDDTVQTLAFLYYLEQLQILVLQADTIIPKDEMHHYTTLLSHHMMHLGFTFTPNKKMISRTQAALFNTESEPNKKNLLSKLHAPDQKPRSKAHSVATSLLIHWIQNEIMSALFRFKYLSLGIDNEHHQDIYQAASKYLIIIAGRFCTAENICDVSLSNVTHSKQLAKWMEQCRTLSGSLIHAFSDEDEEKVTTLINGMLGRPREQTPGVYSPSQRLFKPGANTDLTRSINSESPPSYEMK